jgi:3-oxoacyl-[acyl-carrier protein] reductase
MASSRFVAGMMARADGEENPALKNRFRSAAILLVSAANDQQGMHAMDFGLNGKTALVFGASGGLGAAMARALAGEGANVVLASRNEAALATMAQEITAFGVRAHPMRWDLADLASHEANFAAAQAAFGPIDILVNNTGGPPPTPASGQDPQVWAAQFNAMVLSVIRITDLALPGMRERKWGRIITSTSSGVIAPIPNLGISNTLRAALVAWSKTLSREVARDGVTANVIVPGRVATDRIAFLDAQRAKRENRTVDDIQRESAAAIPVGRLGDPAEYGAAAAFLASRQASYITGSVLRVDGGMIPNI